MEITLITHAYGGDALGRLPDGRAAFVPFALPGEHVRADVIEDKKGHVRAELVEVLVASPERVAPPCPHFMRCGGCQYQHMTYAAQLKAKAEIVSDQLQRIGGIAKPPLRPIVGCPQPLHYRNHVQFHLTPAGKLGFQARQAQEVVAIQTCLLLEPSLAEIWPQLDIEALPGLERVALRLGAGDDIQLILESSDPQPLEFSVEELPLSAVHLGPGGALVLAGSEQVVMEALGRSFQVSAGAFFQVNTPMAEAMVQHILDILPLSPSDTVLDVYCGVGLFSAFLAGRCARLVGIEASPQACADFVFNLDQFDNVELYAAPAEDVLPHMAFHPQVILVDPPRAGLAKPALDGLLAQQARYIAYISCDPATLARDLRRLLAAGYRLEHVTPFDMFPQTAHVESVALLSKATT